MKFLTLLPGILMLSAATVAQGDDSLMTLESFLHTVQGADFGQLTEVNDLPTRRIFHDYSFYSVRFTGQDAPAPLKSHNLFAVSTEGNIMRFSDKDELAGFFEKHIHSAIKERAQTDAMKAWLRMAEEFRQNGTLLFSISDDSIQVIPGDENTKVTGVAMVVANGTGEIDATLTFDSSGRLIEVQSSDKGGQ